MANRNKKLMKEQEVATNEVATTANDNIVDIDLSVTERKRFRIDGDNNRILYLNTSDMGMVTRLEEAENQLTTIQKDIEELKTLANSDDYDVAELSFKFENADKQMRNLIDYVFDSNVSDICAPDGTMYDPFEGKPRYEHIIDRLIPLYEHNISKEAKALSQKSAQYTKKYTK